MSFPLEVFECHAISGRRERLCPRCRASEINDAPPVWTWADGVRKTAAMSRLYVTEVMGVDAIAIKALLQIQKGKCVLSGRELLLPDETLRVGQTVLAWAQKRSSDAVLWAPSLQRIVPAPAGTWTLGNVVLVAAVFAPVVTRLGIYPLLALARELIVPQAAQIQKVAYEIAEKHHGT